jgi:thioredoxin-related protein
MKKSLYLASSKAASFNKNKLHTFIMVIIHQYPKPDYMKKIIVFIIFSLPFFTFAQDTGMVFQHNLSWKELQAKALQQNKFIFMDCYTTWCGPCRYMSNTVFPMRSVGDFMNDKFIAVKVQLDTTKKDDDAVKAWYQTGHDLAKQYDIEAYPTYLVFDPKGNIVHRFVGSSSGDEFIANAQKSLVADSQYYTLLHRYFKGDKNPSFLRLLAQKALDAYDMKNAAKIGNEYLNATPNLYTKENIKLLSELTISSKDPGFRIMLHNGSKVDAVMGEGTAASAVDQIIIREVVFPHFNSEAKGPPDWKTINRTLQQKYPSQAPEVLAKSKVMWYQIKRDWNKFQYAVVDYINKYGKSLPDNDLNEYAWTVFQNCKDMKCVAEALNWSRRSFKKEKVPGYIDTYANLLYKQGKKEEAISWEEKARDAAAENDKKGYQDVIDKMQKNEKTWN